MLNPASFIHLEERQVVNSHELLSKQIILIDIFKVQNIRSRSTWKLKKICGFGLFHNCREQKFKRCCGIRKIEDLRTFENYWNVYIIFFIMIAIFPKRNTRTSEIFLLNEVLSLLPKATGLPIKFKITQIRGSHPIPHQSVLLGFSLLKTVGPPSPISVWKDFSLKI